MLNDNPNMINNSKECVTHIDRIRETHYTLFIRLVITFNQNWYLTPSPVHM